MMKLTNEETVPVNSDWGRWLGKVKGFFPAVRVDQLTQEMPKICDLPKEWKV